MNFPSLQTDHYLLRKLEYKRTDKKVDMISAYLQTSPKVRLHHFPPFQSPNHTENPKGKYILIKTLAHIGTIIPKVKEYRKFRLYRL